MEAVYAVLGLLAGVVISEMAHRRRRTTSAAAQFASEEAVWRHEERCRFLARDYYDR